MTATVTVHCDHCGVGDGGDPDYYVGETIGIAYGWGRDGEEKVCCPDCLAKSTDEEE